VRRFHEFSFLDGYGIVVDKEELLFRLQNSGGKPGPGGRGHRRLQCFKIRTSKEKRTSARKAEQRFPLCAGKTPKRYPNEVGDMGWEIRKKIRTKEFREPVREFFCRRREPPIGLNCITRRGF
jgi:hypothetical protein